MPGPPPSCQENHIQIGIEALKLIRRNGKSVRHLRVDE